MIYTGEGSAVDAYFQCSGEPTCSPPKNTCSPPKNTCSPPKNTCSPPKNWGKFESTNQQHRNILRLLREANITKKDQRLGEVADMTGWFSAFLKSNRCPVNKPLLEMTPKEVSKIITALEGVAQWKATINYQ